MRKLSLFLISICFYISATLAQDVAATKTNTREFNPGKKYLRPSLTVIVTDRGNEHYRRMISLVSKYPIPGKFNDHNVDCKSIKINGHDVQTTLYQKLNQDVSRQIVAKWFNRNSKGLFSMELISERGLYNATDADFLKAQISQRKMDLLKDAKRV